MNSMKKRFRPHAPLICLIAYSRMRVRKEPARKWKKFSRPISKISTPVTNVIHAGYAADEFFHTDWPNGAAEMISSRLRAPKLKRRFLFFKSSAKSFAFMPGRSSAYEYPLTTELRCSP